MSSEINARLRLLKFNRHFSDDFAVTLIIDWWPVIVNTLVSFFGLK